MSKEVTGLEALSNQITKNNNDKIEQFTNELYEDLVVALPVANLTEIVFKEYFLDFFKTGQHNNNDAPLTLKWLEVSGGPFNEVNIVDNFGTVIFTTPGMYVRPNVSASLAGTDLNAIAVNYNLKSNRLRNEGLNYLESEIGALNNDIDVVNTEHGIRWQNIFRRYELIDGIEETNIPMALDDNVAAFLDYD